MTRVEIDPKELADVWRLERRHCAKLLFAQVWLDGRAVAELQPVADVGWYIDVWNRVARLVLVTDDRMHVYADDELELDADLLDELVTQVICHDHNSDRDIARAYYPLSQKSVELFRRLMARARPKTKPLMLVSWSW